MNKLLQSLFLSFFLLTSLSSTLDAGIVKNSKAIGTLHKNSKTFKGDSHVYSIQNQKGMYKVGESSQGVNKKGLSKRAESQVVKLQKETGDKSFTSTIRKKFDSKAEAREYETKLIERTRSLYGTDKNDKSVLIGNKTNR